MRTLRPCRRGCAHAWRRRRGTAPGPRPRGKDGGVLVRASACASAARASASSRRASSSSFCAATPCSTSVVKRFTSPGRCPRARVRSRPPPCAPRRRSRATDLESNEQIARLDPIAFRLWQLDDPCWFRRGDRPSAPGAALTSPVAATTPSTILGARVSVLTGAAAVVSTSSIDLPEQPADQASANTIAVPPGHLRGFPWRARGRRARAGNRGRPEGHAADLARRLNRLELGREPGLAR